MISHTNDHFFDSTIKRVKEAAEEKAAAGERRFSLTPLLRRRLGIKSKDADAIADKLIDMAKRGNLKAIEIIFDRLDGKPTERHEISGETSLRLVFIPAYKITEAAVSAQAITEGSAKEITEEARIDKENEVYDIGEKDES